MIEQTVSQLRVYGKDIELSNALSKALEDDHYCFVSVKSDKDIENIQLCVPVSILFDQDKEIKGRDLPSSITITLNAAELEKIIKRATL